ncbi:hypothetical protein BU17DRAFT_66950 [Hysterangium stoloniferum]|nr:hypothetical protein BU17DRAFT_66950 [Hysterangium stoloniferum]
MHFRKITLDRAKKREMFNLFFINSGRKWCIGRGGGVVDFFGGATYQALIYWIMAIQSAGAAGNFGMDAVKTPYWNERTNYDDEKIIHIDDLKDESHKGVI